MSARTSVEYEHSHHEQHQRHFSTSSYGSMNDEKAGDSAISTIPPTPSGMLTPNPAFGSSTSSSGHMAPYFRSRRKRPEDVSRPWAQSKKDKALGSVWHWLLPLIAIFLGLAGAAVRIYFAAAEYPQLGYCPVLMEDFASGTLDPNVWTQEVETGGYGNGQFEMTTANGENAYVENGMLVIKPTFTDQDLINNDNVINLLGNGCTSDSYWSCVIATNTTNGTIVNPVRSARINTKKGASIKYGRVEVVAKLPVGDWLWPAIWMLPTDSVYGQWPASGEIDLMESRGNNYTYTSGGNNVVHQTTHWGPDGTLDQYKVTTGGKAALHSTWADAFHTYGLQWTEKYLFTYIDSRVAQIMYQKFDSPAWKRGDFPVTYANGSATVNPWHNGTNSAPFDEDFYLILNLAIGGTNGWFTDGVADKPWTDGSSMAKLQFWEDRANWQPTWVNGGEMQIKSVKMWQQKGYNGC